MFPIRAIAILILSPFLLTSLIHAQEPLPKFAYEQKQSVVKIEIHLKDTRDREKVSDQLQLCFEQSDYCVIGTGVRINDDGNVLTAAHVAKDATAVSQTLRDVGIDSEVMIAGQARNAEYTKADVSGTSSAFNASIKAIDSGHDAAVFEPQRGASTQRSSAIDEVSSFHIQQSRTVKLDLQRPDPTEPIFTFSFPMYSPMLLTTNGSIVLAFGTKNLVEAKKNGDAQLVPIYRAKFDIAPGNTGGPLFRSSDGALLGIVGEIGKEPDPVATVIPSAEIAKFLSANAIKWNAAPPKPTNSKRPKSSHKIFHPF